jgi:TetR/AcrR family transcriptional regulator, repressor of fatR-cypB operon
MAAGLKPKKKRSGRSLRKPLKKSLRKPSRRDAILDAMLEIVVERGFHDAPMSLIARRSGASAGIIYHYFSSKQEIIEALYERIRTLKREAFLGNFDPGQDPEEVFVQMAIDLYTFYREHQREVRFYEQYELAGFGCMPDKVGDDPRAMALSEFFSSRSRGGVLKEWPPEVLEEMTVGLVTRLASQPKKISKSLLREIAEATWEAVKA